MQVSRESKHSKRDLKMGIDFDTLFEIGLWDVDELFCILKADCKSIFIREKRKEREIKLYAGWLRHFLP